MTTHLSRRHPLNAVSRLLGKEISEFVANDLRLTEHEVAARVEADKPSAGNARRRVLTRFVRGELIVLGMDDKSRDADRLQVVVVDVGVGDGRVEVVPLGHYGEQTV